MSLIGSGLATLSLVYFDFGLAYLGCNTDSSLVFVSLRLAIWLSLDTVICLHLYIITLILQLSTGRHVC